MKAKQRTANNDAQAGLAASCLQSRKCMLRIKFISAPFTAANQMSTRFDRDERVACSLTHSNLNAKLQKPI